MSADIPLHALARAIWSEAPADAAPAITRHPAFAVYRNTVLKGCVDALQANYPAVARLVGEGWFHSTATLYARAHPPVDGRLVLYVEHYLNPAYFPGIERFDLTRSLTDLYASHYGIRYGRVRFEMLPTILPAEAAGPLRVSVGSPIQLHPITHSNSRGNQPGRAAGQTGSAPPPTPITSASA